MRKLLSVLLSAVMVAGSLTIPVSENASADTVYNLNNYYSRTQSEVNERFIAAQTARTLSYYDEEPSAVYEYNGGQLNSDTHHSMTAMLNFYRWLMGISELNDSVHQQTLQRAAVLRRVWADNSSSLQELDRSKPSDMDQSFYDEGYNPSDSTNNMAGVPQNHIRSYLNQGYSITQRDNYYFSSQNPGRVRSLLFSYRTTGVNFGYAFNWSVAQRAGNTGTTNLPFVSFPPAGDCPTNIISPSSCMWSVELNSDQLTFDDISSVHITITHNGTTFTRSAAEGNLTYNNGLICFGQPDDYLRRDGNANVSAWYYDGTYAVTITGLKTVSGGAATATFTTNFYDASESQSSRVASFEIPASRFPGLNLTGNVRGVSLCNAATNSSAGAGLPASQYNNVGQILGDTVVIVCENGNRYEVPVSGNWEFRQIDDVTAVFANSVDPEDLPPLVNDPSHVLDNVYIPVIKMLAWRMLPRYTTTVDAGGSVTFTTASSQGYADPNACLFLYRNNQAYCVSDSATYNSSKYKHSFTLTNMMPSQSGLYYAVTTFNSRYTSMQTDYLDYIVVSGGADIIVNNPNPSETGSLTITNNVGGDIPSDAPSSYTFYVRCGTQYVREDGSFSSTKQPFVLARGASMTISGLQTDLTYSVEAAEVTGLSDHRCTISYSGNNSFTPTSGALTGTISFTCNYAPITGTLTIHNSLTGIIPAGRPTSYNFAIRSGNYYVQEDGSLGSEYYFTATIAGNGISYTHTIENLALNREYEVVASLGDVPAGYSCEITYLNSELFTPSLTTPDGSVTIERYYSRIPTGSITVNNEVTGDTPAGAPASYEFMIRCGDQYINENGELDSVQNAKRYSVSAGRSILISGLPLGTSGNTFVVEPVYPTPIQDYEVAISCAPASVTLNSDYANKSTKMTVNYTYQEPTATLTIAHEVTGTAPNTAPARYSFTIETGGLYVQQDHSIGSQPYVFTVLANGSVSVDGLPISRTYQVVEAASTAVLGEGWEFNETVYSPSDASFSPTRTYLTGSVTITDSFTYTQPTATLTVNHRVDGDAPSGITNYRFYIQAENGSYVQSNGSLGTSPSPRYVTASGSVTVSGLSLDHTYTVIAQPLSDLPEGWEMNDPSYSPSASFAPSISNKVGSITVTDSFEYTAPTAILTVNHTVSGAVQASGISYGIAIRREDNRYLQTSGNFATTPYYFDVAANGSREFRGLALGHTYTVVTRDLSSMLDEGREGTVTFDPGNSLDTNTSRSATINVNEAFTYTAPTATLTVSHSASGYVPAGHVCRFAVRRSGLYMQENGSFTETEHYFTYTSDSRTFTGLEFGYEYTVVAEQYSLETGRSVAVTYPQGQSFIASSSNRSGAVTVNEVFSATGTLTVSHAVDGTAPSLSENYRFALRNGDRYVQANGSLGTSPYYFSFTGNDPVIVTGLAINTTYTVEAQSVSSIPEGYTLGTPTYSSQTFRPTNTSLTGSLTITDHFTYTQPTATLTINHTVSGYVEEGITFGYAIRQGNSYLHSDGTFGSGAYYFDIDRIGSATVRNLIYGSYTVEAKPITGLASGRTVNVTVSPASFTAGTGNKTPTVNINVSFTATGTLTVTHNVSGTVPSNIGNYRFSVKCGTRYLNADGTLQNDPYIFTFPNGNTYTITGLTVGNTYTVISQSVSGTLPAGWTMDAAAYSPSNASFTPQNTNLSGSVTVTDSFTATGTLSVSHSVSGSVPSGVGSYSFAVRSGSQYVGEDGTLSAVPHYFTFTGTSPVVISNLAEGITYTVESQMITDLPAGWTMNAAAYSPSASFTPSVSGSLTGSVTISDSFTATGTLTVNHSINGNSPSGADYSFYVTAGTNRYVQADGSVGTTIHYFDFGDSSSVTISGLPIGNTYKVVSVRDTDLPEGWTMNNASYSPSNASYTPSVSALTGTVTITDSFTAKGILTVTHAVSSTAPSGIGNYAFALRYNSQYVQDTNGTLGSSIHYFEFNGNDPVVISNLTVNRTYTVVPRSFDSIPQDWQMNATSVSPESFRPTVSGLTGNITITDSFVYNQPTATITISHHATGDVRSDISYGYAIRRGTSSYLQANGTFGSSAYYFNIDAEGSIDISGLDLQNNYTYYVLARDLNSQLDEGRTYTCSVTPASFKPTSSNRTCTVSITENFTYTEPTATINVTHTVTGDTQSGISYGFAVRRGNDYLQSNGSFSSSAYYFSYDSTGHASVSGLPVGSTYTIVAKPVSGLDEGRTRSGVTITPETFAATLDNRVANVTVTESFTYVAPTGTLYVTHVVTGPAQSGVEYGFAVKRGGMYLQDNGQFTSAVHYFSYGSDGTAAITGLQLGRTYTVTARPLDGLDEGRSVNSTVTNGSFAASGQNRSQNVTVTDAFSYVTPSTTLTVAHIAEGDIPSGLTYGYTISRSNNGVTEYRQSNGTYSSSRYVYNVPAGSTVAYDHIEVGYTYTVTYAEHSDLPSGVSCQVAYPSTQTFVAESSAVSATRSIRETFTATARLDITLNASGAIPSGITNYQVALRSGNLYYNSNGGIAATASYVRVTSGGTATFNNLPLGSTYTVELRSINCPEGVTYAVTYDSGRDSFTPAIGSLTGTVGVNVAFTNTTPDTGAIRISHAVSGAAAPSGISYYEIAVASSGGQYVQDTNGTLGSSICYFRVSATGSVLISGLPVGSYTVSERALSGLPEGYSYTTTRTNNGVCSVTKGGTASVSVTDTFTYTAPTGSLTVINAVSGNRPSSVTSYEFSVRNSGGQYLQNNSGAVGTAERFFTITSVNGSVSFSNLPAGSYTVTARTITGMPEGYSDSVSYSPASSVSVTGNGNARVTVTHAFSYTEPTPSPTDAPCRFTDVSDPSKYYFEPVYWAADNGITTGTTDTTFSPENLCTREQMVTFIWRTMGEPEPENSAYNAYFTDARSTGYYVAAINWAYEQGITRGLNDGSGRFGIGQTCNRAMCVTFLWRAAGSPVVTGSNPFDDVPSGSYFYDAVLWCAQNGITTGTTATTFSPDNNLTRGQCVTFLYRYIHYAT